MSANEWSLEPGQSVTPYEVGGKYPEITVTCTKGGVTVQFITDHIDGISDNGSGVVTRELLKGNSITRKARLVTNSSPKLYSAGRYEVAD